MVLLAATAGLVACGDDDSGDLRAFCAAYDRLDEDDPFARLDVASPGEMRDAFDELRGGARDLVQAAPGDVEVQTTRYAAAVEDLVDQQRAAGYDLRNLDRGGYRRATDAYNEAAVSLENAARAACG